MKKIAIVVHGGAGPDSEFIREHQEEYEEGLLDAVEAGYSVLENGGTATEAVEAAVNSLENNKYFNAGRGSALNAEGKVEMCASMMEGKEKHAGAAAIVTNVKNPISFAKRLLEDTSMMYLGGDEALKTAKDLDMELEPESYFVTDQQVETFLEEREKQLKKDQSNVFGKYVQRMHGTVGAVAVDKKGNVAAGTSTGGTECNQPGRIGDSSMIGVGSYADNKTAAISCTGDGEYLISEVLAHAISAAIEHTQCTVQEACNYAIQVKNGDSEGDMGAIAVDAEANVAMAFNSERMHRAWRTSQGDKGVKIYK